MIFDVAGYMRDEYINTAISKAKYEILSDDNTYYGEIPGFDGIYANVVSLEECRRELEEILEEWVLLRISRNLSFPVVNGIELNIKEVV